MTRLVVAMLLLFGLTGFVSKDSVTLKKCDRIVFFGDSITAQGGSAVGYVSLMKNSINKVNPNMGEEMINASVAGNCVRDLQTRLQAGVLGK